MHGNLIQTHEFLLRGPGPLPVRSVPGSNWKAADMNAKPEDVSSINAFVLAKLRLREGKSLLGVHIPFPLPAVVELAGTAGFHWVLIDCEHGPMNHETVETMIRAAESAGITPIVRPPRNEAASILRYLEMGAQGVFVPNVQSRSVAGADVRNAKFNPRR